MIESLGLFLIFLPTFTTFFWFLGNVFFSLPLNIYSLILFSLLSVIINYFLFLRHRLVKFHFTGINLASLIPFLILILVFCLSLLLNLYWPVATDFDAVANYDYRAKIFYDQQKITGLTHQYLVSYPLFTSLGHTIMYTLGFSSPRFFYSYLFFGFLLIFYARLRTKTTSPLAVVGCLLLATTPAVFHFVITAYTNLPYMIFLGGSFLYLADYLKSPSKSKFLIFSLLMAYAAWIRPATHIFLLANYLLLIIYQRKIYWLPLVLYSLVFLPWWYFQQFLNTISTYEAARTTQALSILLKSLTQIHYPLKAAWDILLDLKYSGFIGLIFLFIMLKKYKLTPLVLVFLVNFLVWMVLALAIRAEYTEFNQWVSILYDSMRRLFIIFYPLIIVNILSLTKANIKPCAE